MLARTIRDSLSYCWAFASDMNHRFKHRFEHPLEPKSLRLLSSSTLLSRLKADAQKGHNRRKQAKSRSRAASEQA